MLIKKLTAICLATLLLILSSCSLFSPHDGGSVRLNSSDDSTEGNYQNDSPPTTLLLSALSSEQNLDAADSAKAEKALLDSSFKLFSEAVADGKKSGNVLISPLSIYMALAMTSLGAEGETLSGMEEVLGDATGLDRAVYLRSLTKSLTASEKIKLGIANSLWARDGGAMNVNSDFIDVAEKYFSAESFKAPFNRGTLTDINNWIEEKTDGMIRDMLKEIPDDAVMYLINALVFEAEWKELYTEYQVRDEKFTTYSKDRKNVSMMRSREDFYLETENAAGFIKPYADSDYAFVALLPDSSADVYKFASSLDAETFSNIIASKKNAIVLAGIPEFKYEYEDSLKNELEGLGMEEAFKDTAEFTGIGTSPLGDICISDVFHKTFIEVSPEGTKAGAATVVEMKAESAAPVMPLDTYEVILNRPFVYAIINVKTNTPLFLGIYAG